MNTRQKGTRMEKLAMDELKLHFNDKRWAAQWRSIANRFNNTDLLGAWDFAVLTTARRLILCQVKSRYSNTDYSFLKGRKPKDTLAFLATYKNVREHRNSQHQHIKTAHFVFHEVF